MLTSTRRVGNPAHQHLRHPADSLALSATVRIDVDFICVASKVSTSFILSRVVETQTTITHTYIAHALLSVSTSFSCYSFLPFPGFSLACPPLRAKETHQVPPCTVQRHALYHSNLGRCGPAESSSRIITPRPDARSPAGCGAARTQARHGWSEVELWCG